MDTGIPMPPGRGNPTCALSAACGSRRPGRKPRRGRMPQEANAPGNAVRCPQRRYADVGRVAGKVWGLAEVVLYGRRASGLKAGYGAMSASPSTSKSA